MITLTALDETAQSLGLSKEDFLDLCRSPLGPAHIRVDGIPYFYGPHVQAWLETHRTEATGEVPQEEFDRAREEYRREKAALNS